MSLTPLTEGDRRDRHSIAIKGAWRQRCNKLVAPGSSCHGRESLFMVLPANQMRGSRADPKLGFPFGPEVKNRVEQEYIDTSVVGL